MEFSSTWLDTRRPYDEEARDPEILSKLTSSLRSLDEIEIWDLGAGTCNSAFTFPQILAKSGARNQKWVFVERDPLLKQKAIENLKRIFPDMKIESCYSHQDCSLGFSQTKYSKMEIHYTTLDISYLTSSTKGNPDVVIANALFDILDTDSVKSLISTFCDSIWYSSLNHRETRLIPKIKLLDEISHLYDQHTILNNQKRLGIEVCTKVPQFFSDARFKISIGKSVWNISKRNDRIMFHHLWGFIENVLHEMGVNAETILEAKTKCNGIVVVHCDLLAIPKTQ